MHTHMSHIYAISICLVQYLYAWCNIHMLFLYGKTIYKDIQESPSTFCRILMHPAQRVDKRTKPPSGLFPPSLKYLGLCSDGLKGSHFLRQICPHSHFLLHAKIAQQENKPNRGKTKRRTKEKTRANLTHTQILPCLRTFPLLVLLFKKK